MHRRQILLGGGALFLAGCSTRWEVGYDSVVDPAVARTWTVSDVIAATPAELSVSNANTFAPNADIVWHGEPFGDRREQVARILGEGVRKGTSGLNGPRRVTVAATVLEFHAVTPASVSRAPGAVHNVRYALQVVDSNSGNPLTEQSVINADLEAYVGASAVTAAIEGNTQRVRIVDHIARVTAGWFGMGPDQRRKFTSIGR